MSKNKQKKKTTPEVVAPTKELMKPAHWLLRSRNQFILIGLLALLVYGNTLQNQWALDDVMFVTMNSFTKKGTDGIKDIFTHESLYGFIGDNSMNAGGRWRPLSIITFALEWEISPNTPKLGHFNNLLLFVISSLLLLHFLRRFVFKQQPLAAFVCTLLFVVHPIHTEVVANIKSRDEILSFMLLLLTMHFSLKFISEGRKPLHLFAMSIFYFMALLSKEYGMTFILVLPMVWYFLSNTHWKQWIFPYAATMSVLVFYFFLRFVFVGGINAPKITEVMNAPFLYATPLQHYCTVLMNTGHYLWLLIFPHPLSYDYSYNQIPYVGITDWRVWAAVIVQGALFVFAIMQWKKKNIASFGVLFYFLTFSIVSNILVDSGVVIGERFLYQPSLGLLIAFTWVVFYFVNKFVSDKKQIANGVLVASLPFVCVGGYATMHRNHDWQNDNTLMIHDVYISPNSARANNGAGTAFILTAADLKDEKQKAALMDSSIVHLEKAARIHPTYVDPWLNLGVAFSRMNLWPQAQTCWERARQLSPNHPKLVVEYDEVMYNHFFNDAMKAGPTNPLLAIKLMHEAQHYRNNKADLYYNMGGAFFTAGTKYGPVNISDLDSAKFYFNKALQIDPSKTDAQNGLNALKNFGVN